MYEKEILDIYQKCNITYFPFSCDDVIHSLGYEIETYSHLIEKDPRSKSIIKKYTHDSFLSRKKHIVFFNDRADNHRQLFSKAHEIGHIVLESDDEDSANTFASNFLAPRPITFQQGLKTAEQIRDYYGISISAANQALIGPFYYPDKYGEELMKYFENLHKPKYKISDIEFRVEYPDPTPEEKWRIETERIESAIADIQAKMFTCKTDKQYDRLNKKYSELLIRRRWQDDIADRCGYIYG